MIFFPPTPIITIIPIWDTIFMIRRQQFMGVYVVTGGSGGIGGKTVEILRS